MLKRVYRQVLGRGYEIALRLGLVKYRRPFQNFNIQEWDRGYAAGEHESYEGLGERGRFGVLVGYLGLIDGPLDIIDIGCGTGVLRGRVPDEKVKSYLGVDTSAEAIRQAQARGQARTRYETSSVPEQGSFDVVICNEMLMLVEDWDDFLTKAARLVRPHGLFLTSNTRYHGDFMLRRKLDEYFDKIDETVVINRAANRKNRIGAYRPKGQGAGARS
jgi:2-polyprenyl-3-methyl-5-hydroxy-6-metoxy-1,4-benzoquinol methylase